MTELTKPQIIIQNNEPAFAVIPWIEYEYFGLTQGGLSQKAGIKQPALARLEKSDANPRKSSLKKLADAMGIALEQLLD